MWIEKNDCCGCGACSNICPNQCIEMAADNEGFKYPVINKEKCINCKLCEKVCPALHKGKNENKIRVYACRHQNDEIVKTSSSGGMFSALASAVINKGGVVFGAMFDSQYNVIHNYIESVDELGKLRGSKYVQSDINMSYKKVKSFLESGRIVLFSGTSCQIAGLKNYLMKEHSNLYCVDVICHGVASPLVFEKYIKALKTEYNQNIKSISFRNKKEGWVNFSFNVIFDKKTYRSNLHNDLYLRGFIQNLFLRESCYTCKYKNFSCGSDLSMADFWGIRRLTDFFGNNPNGVSMVCVNSNKGKALLQIVLHEIKYMEFDLNTAISCNPAIINSASRNKRRNVFFKNIERKPINENIHFCLRTTFRNRINIKIKRLLKKLKV